jgi:hypothetical protein
VEETVAVTDEQVVAGSSHIADQTQRLGRKPRQESRAAEFRRRLIVWEQSPERLRPSLRALADQLNTSHQLLQHYSDGLEEWQWQERCRRAKKEAEEVRARAKAENRQMTFRELRIAIIEPAILNQLESLRQDARCGPLNWYQVQILKTYAGQDFPEAEALLKTCSRLKKKTFAQIVRETPRQEGEESRVWVRRIWDVCEKYGTEGPRGITEELLEELSKPRGKGKERGRNNLPATSTRRR